jgi:hypothetical protein
MHALHASGSPDCMQAFACMLRLFCMPMQHMHVLYLHIPLQHPPCPSKTQTPPNPKTTTGERLRQDMLSRFAGKFTVTRRILAIDSLIE